MSFQQSAESWKAKLHLSGVRAAVLVGVTAVAVVVLVAAGNMLLGTASADGFAVERAPDAAQQVAEEEEAAVAPAPTLRVHVGGAVAAPGVYDLAEGSRVLDAVNLAGGFAEGAARDALNLARAVADGEQVLVPSEADLAASASMPASSDGGASASGSGGAVLNGKININAASAAELDALPGVGASTAEKIVADREANGPFKTIEDLKRVSGIGDKKFAALADAICVA